MFSIGDNFASREATSVVRSRRRAHRHTRARPQLHARVLPAMPKRTQPAGRKTATRRCHALRCEIIESFRGRQRATQIGLTFVDEQSDIRRRHTGRRSVRLRHRAAAFRTRLRTLLHAGGIGIRAPAPPGSQRRRVHPPAWEIAVIRARTASHHGDSCRVCSFPVSQLTRSCHTPTGCAACSRAAASSAGTMKVAPRRVFHR
jgi:hypothetical protein